MQSVWSARAEQCVQVTQQLCYTFEQSPIRNARSPTPQVSGAVSGHTVCARPIHTRPDCKVLCVQSPAQETAAMMTRSIRQEMQSLKDQLDQAQSNEVGSMVL